MADPKIELDELPEEAKDELTGGREEGEENDE